MNISVNSEYRSYNVIVKNNTLSNIDEFIDYTEGQKTLLVTDSGVPEEYIHKLFSKINITDTVILNNGEGNKNYNSVEKILSVLCKNKFNRQDRIIAFGGGIVGDLAGFSASVYMRGIEYINIPTTLLAQVDSSIGGKTGFNFEGHKNLIGSFYPPSKVIIDPTLTKSQNKRDFYCGMIEALKMAVCFDRDLYNNIKTYNEFCDLENIICRSLLIKKHIVESDEKESGIRKILNFGHTVGHAIELTDSNILLHGECVGIGMLYVVPDKIREELISILKKWNIPYNPDLNIESVKNNILYDKKANSNGIELVLLSDYCKPYTKTLTPEEIDVFLRINE